MTVTITSPGPSTAYTEGTAASTVDSTLAVSSDSASLSSATVAISTGFLAGDILSFTATGSITGTYDASTGILTLSGAGTNDQYKTVLDSVTFISSSQNPTDAGHDASRTIRFTASDTTGAAQVDHALNITAVNNAPTATANASYSATTNQSLSLKNSGLSVADVDGGDQIESATLTVSAGTLSVDAGTSGATVTTSGSSVTINGTVAQINALLNTNASSSISYIDPSANPSVSLTFSISDGGNTGGTDKTGTASSVISVTDAPTPPPPTVQPPVVTFDSTISPYGPTVTLSGRASAAGGLTGVELFEGSLDLGAATVNPDGSWSFDYHNGAGFHTGLTAVASDSQSQQTSAAATFDLTTGIVGQGYRTVQDNHDSSGAYTGSIFFKRFGAVYYEAAYATLPGGGSAYTYSDGTFFNTQAYSSFTDTYDAFGNVLKHVENNYDGSHLINAIADGVRVSSIANDTFTSDGIAERFVFRHGAGAETIANFQAAGAGHDVAVLPASAAGRLGQILAQGYGDGQGNTTINYGQDSITFIGVSKAELRSHPGDFAFHA